MSDVISKTRYGNHWSIPATSTKRLPPISNRGWARKFDEPIALPDGRALRTLRDAGTTSPSFRKPNTRRRNGRAAMEALILVADLGGPTMFARIGIMKALNRQASGYSIRPTRIIIGESGS